MVINGAPYSTNRLENPGLVPIVPACSRSDGWGAASGRLRRSRPPAQDCGRQTATLGPKTVQPQRGCAPNAVPASVQAGTALRFNRYSARSQGGPHSIRPTLGWRP